MLSLLWVALFTVVFTIIMAFTIFYFKPPTFPTSEENDDKVETQQSVETLLTAAQKWSIRYTADKGMLPTRVDDLTEYGVVLEEGNRLVIKPVRGVGYCLYAFNADAVTAISKKQSIRWDSVTDTVINPKEQAPPKGVC